MDCYFISIDYFHTQSLRSIWGIEFIVKVRFLQFLQVYLTPYLFINLYRNRFLNENTLKFVVIIRKKDSIQFIKLFGHQHRLLNDIMDQLNICWSFKVIYSLIGYFILFELTQTLFNIKLDNGQHCCGIYVNNSGSLCVVSNIDAK